MDNAGNEVYRVSGIIPSPEDWNFSVCTRDQCLVIFLIYDIQTYYLSFVISFIVDILGRIMTFSERYSVFFMVMQK